MLLRWGFPGSGTIPDCTSTPPSPGLSHPDERGSGVPGGRGLQNRGLGADPTALRVQAAVTCGYLCCD